MPFYKLLNEDAEIETTKRHVESLEVINMDLIKVKNVRLQLPKPSLEYVYLCDASYHGSGFVKNVEDFVNETGKKKKKTLPPLSFGLHLFNATK